jgi:hypothetical protein
MVGDYAQTYDLVGGLSLLVQHVYPIRLSVATGKGQGARLCLEPSSR